MRASASVKQQKITRFTAGASASACSHAAIAIAHANPRGQPKLPVPRHGNAIDAAPFSSQRF